MSSERIPLWIDCDTGVDDAVMLMVATQLDCLDIKGVTAVAGNVEVEKTFKNTRNVLSLCKREDIKVYPGAGKPLYVPQETAKYVHGEDGLCGAVIVESNAPVETLHGYDVMYQCAKENGKLTIAAVGPLTDIAIAIVKYPDLVNYVDKIVIMGGAVEGGNKTPEAEFNIYVDPHAAQTVFKSGIPVYMFGLDVTQKSSLTMDEVETIFAGTNAKQKLFRDSVSLSLKIFKERFGVEKVCLHDVCPIMYLAYPDMFTLVDAGVYVETEAEITLGKTVCDVYSDFKFKDRHCKVALDLKRDDFAQKVIELLAK